MASIFDKALDNIQNGRNSLRTLPTSSDRPIGTTAICEKCNETVEWRQITNAKGKSIRYWSDCQCIHGAIVRAQEFVRRAAELDAGRNLEVVSDTTDLSAFAFETFDPSRLTNGGTLLNIARGWLDAIAALPVAPSYHENPRACLYFYSAGKGRGKTHLAGAVLNAARANGRLAAFADEITYIEAYWAAPLDERTKLSALPGERAWLSVLDDLGQKESTGAGLRDAWYDVINPRWLKRGWTVITSNWTPDELLSRGTINEATYSRIVQMTRGKLVAFDGSDQRLPGGEA